MKKKLTKENKEKVETQKKNYVSNQSALFPFTRHKMTNTQKR